LQLTIGGTVGANAHDQGLLLKPFVGDVQSLRLLLADGDLVECSREKNLSSSLWSVDTWRIVDCRTWTTMVPMKGEWKVEGYRWPEVAVLNQLK
jgi:hypothetical protein